MDKYLQANRALWDEWTGINYRSDFYKVEAFKAGQNATCHLRLCRPLRPPQAALPNVRHRLHLARGTWLLPDIQRWAQVVTHFLKPGGVFYITEIHPFAQVFDDDDGVTELRFRYPYFTTQEPLAFTPQGSYADRSATVKAEHEYAWNHSMGEIVTALATNGLRVEFLHEFTFCEWPVSFLLPGGDGRYRLPPELDGKLPLFFSLRAS